MANILESSLHCIICFDEFDLHDRPPVVLPCGHTYVCRVCAKKITKCMECREPLYWTPPPSHSAMKNAPVSHIHRSPVPTGRTYAAARNARLGIGAPQTPPHPSTVQKEEPVPLPLPKNLVLMEMIEAKERQDRVMRDEAAKRKERRRRRGWGLNREHGRENEFENDSNARCDDDDSFSTTSSASSAEGGMGHYLDPSVCGLSGFTGTCGTYVVRDPVGLVVLPQHPNRRLNLHPARQTSHLQMDPSLHGETTEKHDINVLMHGLEIEQDGEDPDEKKEQSIDNVQISGSDVSEITASKDCCRPPGTYSKEPFKIEEGQRVQVVSVDDGVFQLARGVGYIVASANQLVKVGGPLEASCKLEGMLSSAMSKQREAQKNMAKLDALVEGLREKILLALDQPEDIPVISAAPKCDSPAHVTIVNPETIQEGESHLIKRPTSTTPTGSGPATPPKANHRDSSSPGQVQHSLSADSTSVELGLTPRTPGYPPSSLLEMENNLRYIDSPAHSCPMPSNAALDHPYIDGTPTGLPRYRVNSEEDLYGLSWAGALGCGSTLFGERLLEPTVGGNEMLTLSFDENSLLNDPSTRQRAAALAAAAGTAVTFPYSGSSAGSNDSPIRSGGSFDGVNFRTGMSGHRGVSAAPRRQRNVAASSITMSRPRIRMMSEHRGIAAARNTVNAPPNGTSSLKRRTPDGFVG